MECGSCNGRHETLEQVRLCSQGQAQPTIAASPSRASYQPNMDEIVTGSCRKLTCKETHTGPRSELAGWACPEHDESAPKFAVGDKASWRDKRWEILEINDGQARLRTGGAGKLVPISDLQPV